MSFIHFFIETVINEIKCQTACSIILNALSLGPSLSGPCFFLCVDRCQMSVLIPLKTWCLILCISEATSGLPFTGGVMLDSFLPYINNIMKVLPLHQVLPGVTRGGLGSLREIEHPASPPSPSKSQGKNPAGNPESFQRRMLNQLAAALGRRSGYQFNL